MYYNFSVFVKERKGIYNDGMQAIKFKIEPIILENYVKSINSLEETIKQIKEELNKKVRDNLWQFKSIKVLIERMQDFLCDFPKEKANIYIDIIRQLMIVNNGIISTRMIEPLNISRQYLKIMEDACLIERISRGVYILTDTFEDSYFSFQLRYKKAVFSHMNALYFYDLTEEFPYTYTVTVPQSYHVDMVNEKCNVFYVSKDIYDLGLTEIKTPNGNLVKAYDRERCICDIIRSKGRMDFEQVKKSVRMYVKSRDKDIVKLTEYSKKMGVDKEVLELIVGIYYE